jgi:LytS/YehU family sensor histidine kinase
MTTTFSILYLDDEPDNLIAFKAVFRRFFEVSTAENAREALAILDSQKIDLIISDQRMPGMTGVEFFEKIQDAHPNIIRMILTGYSDMQAIIDAINKGKIYYYITKPWKFEELKVILDNALETYALRAKNEQLEVEKKELLFKTLQQEKAHIASQYEILKNQINPHFLFNCLNTLASLIVSDQQGAVRFTTRFAKMYRNLLEYGDQQLISLEKELELIETYLFLQKIRFGRHLNVQKDIPDTRYALPPFSLQLLIENAIKHNVISEEKPLEIIIKSGVDTLEISNKINLRPTTESSTGIGLTNLNQRYQLLLSKGIICTAEGGVFKVVIPLIPDA